MAQCPSCNKFAALEMQEPEVNSLELDMESKQVTAEVRIVRNSECCSEEMKEYTFNTEVDIPEEIVSKMEEIKIAAEIANPEASVDFEAEDGGVDQLEEGGSRYKKSYYGYTLTAIIKHGEDELGKVELSDKIEASGMDELT